ncbi:hypothetical protein GobsT_23950 [Gemmata obscuriglobus]|uniref:Transposase IS4-like domain-containing protein n=1 Tax=Gemmata obscuriglobus TaxID=114 RepID=A0A2Z3H4Q0_9BACT|nr:hypothetical protein [Gemmata obscuriglobus]AWM39302.1 hypothetical protein C1280_21465 [Gemmata obscuriglobus]QEG27636.1 hypothetical protein GobsT_23950 [Gemmata obscuriglobus]VTS04795.1 transposase family protein : Transposase family protein OS=Singulisphaera acidiphila (strain ATCC BAA-1392 / DSM 18658 / VKM B-2454 / MOB10) GN=Sinac_2040 PE=4 SV=1: DDE_Tnp_1 [Gemmata obscuriglobus UQM 2246]
MVGGKPKDGAKWFWGYATAVALVPGHRHTLGLTGMRPGDTPDARGERLRAQLGWAGVKVRYVLLDRGFDSARVANALARRQLRFIIPMVRRGKAVPPLFRRGTRGGPCTPSGAASAGRNVNETRSAWLMRRPCQVQPPAFDADLCGTTPASNREKRLLIGLEQWYLRVRRLTELVTCFAR